MQGGLTAPQKKDGAGLLEELGFEGSIGEHYRSGRSIPHFKATMAGTKAGWVT